MMSFNNASSQPKLVMLIEPESMFRFRYESELNKKSQDGISNDGTISHGGILGKSKAKDYKKEKVYPTIQLLNYNGKKKVQIRVSLYTEEGEKHVLEIRGRNTENGMCYQDLDDDFTATFKSLIVMTYTQKEIIKSLMDQKPENSESRKRGARKEPKQNYGADIKEKAKKIMNSVKLCFEAFTKDNPSKLICDPLFSAPIYNQKNPEKIPLKIDHLSHYVGSWKGNETVILLCDKVQKDKIKVRFYEVDDDDKVTWEEYALFNKDVHVHHQVAIIFRTPKFRSNIEKEVNVCLVRDDDMSSPVKFRYISDKDDLLNSSKKRKLDINLESTYFPLHQSSYPGDTPSPSSSGDSFENHKGQRLEQANLNVQNYPVNPLNANQPYQRENESLYSPSSAVTVNTSCQDNLEDMDVLIPEEDIPKDIYDILESHKSPSIYDVLFEEDIFQLIEVNELSMLPDGVREEMKNHHDFDSFPPSRSRQDIFVDKCETTTAKISIEKSMSNLTLNDRRETITLNTSIIKLKEKFLKHLSERDKSNNTLLHRAVFENKNVARVLKLSKIINFNIVNLKNNSDKTALHIATEKNDCQNLDLLLKYGGHPYLKDLNGNSCFHIAAEYDYVNCIKEIIKHGHLDVNVFNNEGLNPLHVAVMQGSIECVQCLQTYADVNERDKRSGRAPLHYAVEMKPFLLPILLSSNVINLNIQDFAGNTPLYIASVSQDSDSVNQLLEAGADPNIRKYKLNFPIADEDSENEEVENVFDNVEETTVDVATNLEIKKLLQGRSIQSEDSLPVLHPCTEQKLCKLLDPGKYKNLVECSGMDRSVIENVHKIDPSPTKAIMECLKKEYPNNFIGHLKSIFEIANLNDAVQIIEEQQN